MNPNRSTPHATTPRILLVMALMLGAHAGAWASTGIARGAADLLERAALATHDKVCSFDHTDTSHLPRHTTLVVETAAQHLYRKGQTLRASDKAVAFEYLVASSRCWHFEGAYAAATMAMTGEGMPADRDLALALHKRAADMGHVEAAYEAAVLMFKRGDKADGEKYLRQAAEGGHPMAQRMLAAVDKVTSLVRP